MNMKLIKKIIKKISIMNKIINMMMKLLTHFQNNCNSYKINEKLKKKIPNNKIIKKLILGKIILIKAKIISSFLQKNCTLNPINLIQNYLAKQNINQIRNFKKKKVKIVFKTILSRGIIIY